MRKCEECILAVGEIQLSKRNYRIPTVNRIKLFVNENFCCRHSDSNLFICSITNHNRKCLLRFNAMPVNAFTKTRLHTCDIVRIQHSGIRRVQIPVRCLPSQQASAPTWQQRWFTDYLHYLRIPVSCQYVCSNYKLTSLLACKAT